MDFFPVHFLVQEMHSIALPEFRQRFNGFSLSVLVLVTALMNFYESALYTFFGKTQTFKIYVRLIVCIILQGMSKYLAGSAKKLWQIYVVLCSLKLGSKDTVGNR